MSHFARDTPRDIPAYLLTQRSRWQSATGKQRIIQPVFPRQRKSLQPFFLVPQIPTESQRPLGMQSSQLRPLASVQCDPTIKQSRVIDHLIE